MTAGRPLRARTQAFALSVLRFIDVLPGTGTTQIVRWQLGRAAAAVGANYRRACLAQSGRDFVAKLKTVEEEVDESAYWLDLIVELRLGDLVVASTLRDEAAQIRAMITASIKTVRARFEGR